MFDYDFRFASLLNPDKYVFTFHSKYWTAQSADYSIGNFSGVYETYGAGMTQHADEYRASFERLWTDYLGSLAAFLLQPAPFQLAYLSDPEKSAIELVASKWPNQIQDTWIDFAFTIVCNEDKRMYYTFEDGLKTSRSESKRHDKRWHEVERWMDGTTQSAFRILLGDPEGWQYRTVFEKYALYKQVRQYAYTWELPCGESVSLYFKLGSSVKDGWTDYDAETAYDMVDGLVKGFRQAEQSRRNLSSFLHNVKAKESFEKIYGVKEVSDAA